LETPSGRTEVHKTFIDAGVSSGIA
jgi:hypothetical protein